MPVIVTLSGPNPGRKFPITKRETVLGRENSRCDVWLESPAVSRLHAIFTYDNGRYFIQDNKSANGTLVNGQFIQPNSPVPLTESDRFEIGPYEFAVRDEIDDSDSRAKIRLTVSA